MFPMLMPASDASRAMLDEELLREVCGTIWHDAAYSFAPKMPASRPRTMNTAVTHRMNRRLTHSLPASSSRSISRSACGGMLFSVFMFLRLSE